MRKKVVAWMEVVNIYKSLYWLDEACKNRRKESWFSLMVIAILN